MKPVVILLLGFAYCALSLTAISPSRAGETWPQLRAPSAMPAAAQSGYAPVNDIKMYYAIFGHGDPVLLLHDGLANADFWAQQIPALAEHFQVIVADSRGHGRSTRSERPYSYQLMASDAVTLMDYLKIDKAAIVGWRDGGIIGLNIAMSHPERLNKLFVFGANYGVGGLDDDLGQNPAFSAYMDMAGREYERLSKTHDDYQTFVDAIMGMWNSQPNYTAEQLGKIGVPTMIADGEHDEGIWQEHTKEIAASIPGAQWLLMPDVGHFAMWQNAESFNQLLIDFLIAPDTLAPSCPIPGALCLRGCGISSCQCLQRRCR